MIRELEGPGAGGFNRINWDLRYPLGFDIKGGGDGYYPLRGPLVLPGEYTVKLIVGDQEMSQKVMVRVDPRIEFKPEALQARLKASQGMNEVARAFLDVRNATSKIETELNRLSDNAKNRGDIPAEMSKMFQEIRSKLKEVKEDFRRERFGIQSAIMDLLGQLEASTSAPTEAQLETIDHLRVRIERAIQIVNILLSENLPELQRQLNIENSGLLISETVKPPKRY